MDIYKVNVNYISTIGEKQNKKKRIVRSRCPEITEIKREARLKCVQCNTRANQEDLLTYLLTYLLTPWSRVLLEKLTGSEASQEIPCIFGTRRFITVLTSARNLSLS